MAATTVAAVIAIVIIAITVNAYGSGPKVPSPAYPDR
jgi:hypothetical protein